MDNTSYPLHTQQLPWMPLEPGVWARPLWLVGEQRSLQLKVDPGIEIGRHRHSGYVHAFNVSGSRQLGNGAIAGPGAYVYEPPGNEDSWRCVGDEPCIVQITMSGRLEYVNGQGEVTSFTDTQALRAQYLEWCQSQHIEPQAIGSTL